MAKKKMIWKSTPDIEDYRTILAEILEVNPSEVEDDALWEYGYHCLDRDLEDEYANIKAHEESHGTEHYIIMGTAGLWDGPRDCGKVVYGMRSVFSACMEEDTEIFFEGIKMQIRAAHHDGVNLFHIKELTPYGKSWYERNEGKLTPWQLISGVWDDRRKSRNVRIFKQMYGF